MSNICTYPLCGALSLILLISNLGFGAVGVEHSELGFRLNLPDDFERVPEEEQSEDFVRVYSQARVDGPLAITVAIERLHGVLPRLNLDEAPDNPNVQVSTERWKQFDVLVARVSEAIHGVPAIVLNVQVPLKPEAIQLKLIGPSSQEPYLREIIRQSLTTLEGSTNWLTTEERSQRLVEGTSRLGTTVVFVAAIAIAMAVTAKNLWNRGGNVTSHDECS